MPKKLTVYIFCTIAYDNASLIQHPTPIGLHFKSPGKPYVENDIISQSPLHLLHGIILKFSVFLHNKAGLFISPAKAPPIPPARPPLAPPIEPIAPLIPPKAASGPAAPAPEDAPPAAELLPLPAGSPIICCISAILISGLLSCATEKEMNEP